MKKILALSFLFSLFVQAGQAVEIGAGVKFGYRTLKNPSFQDIYGGGYVINPFIMFSPFNLLNVEFSYEGGYKRAGKVGIFQEESILKINGWEMSGLIRPRIGKIRPYLKLGIGYYFYKQDIESEFVRLKVDHHKMAFISGAGVNITFFNGAFLGVEVKYVSIKVRPYDINVDLSGIRYLVSLGFETGEQ